MGVFLSLIDQKTIDIDDSLLNCTYSKLIEYYSSYKSICEGYTINIAEYTHIFGSNQLSFAVWDRQKRAKIDAIEMFTGLIVFSDIRYEQKIKFLFQIFDFNEQGFLYYQNLALMLLNICNSTFKIYSLDQTMPHAQIQMFLDEYFTQESRMELSKLLRWIYRVPIINEYFRIIGHELQQLTEDRKISVYDWQSYDFRQTNTIKTYLADRDFSFDSKFIAAINTIAQKKTNQQLQMLNFSVDWIFGINVSKSTIRFLRVEGRKAGNQRIIYTVGRVVVMYYPKLNTQKYYVGHQKPISVIQVGHHHKMIASGQAGEYPQIHIWDAKTRRPLFKFKRLHKFSIKFISFINSDRMLVTVSINAKESPIIVINLQSQQVIMSTFLKMQSLGIWANPNSSVFSIVAYDSLATFTPVNASFNVGTVRLKQSELKVQKMLCFINHPKGFLITCHKGRRVLVWDDKVNAVDLVFKPCSNKQVLQMCFLPNDYLLLLDQDDVELVQIDKDEWKVVKNQLLEVRSGNLFNLRLAALYTIDATTLLVVSEFGDLVRVEGVGEAVGSDLRMTKIYQLFRLQEAYDCCSLNADTIVIFSGFFLYVIDRNQKQLRILNKLDYELKKADFYKDYLIVSAPIQNGKGSLLFVLSVIDFTVKETTKIQQAVQDLKIAQNYLLVLSEHVLYIYQRSSNRFFQKEFFVQKISIGKPLCLSRTLDSRTFLLITENRELFKVIFNSFSQIDISRVQKQTQTLFETLVTCYSQQRYNYPMLVTCNRRLIAVGRKNGDICIWKSLNQASSCWNSYSSMKLHSDKISRLLLEDEQMISVGGQDGMVVLYNHNSYVQKEDDDAFFDNQCEDQQHKEQTVTHSNFSAKKQVVVDDILGSYLKQSQIQLYNLAQVENTDIRQIIQDIVQPRNKQIYQTFGRPLTPNTYETLRLQITNIYGMSTTKTNSVFYLHNYLGHNNSTNICPSYWQPDPPIDLSPQELQYAKKTLLPLDQEHTNCKREILYFSDRICILRDNDSRQQRFYEYHRRKITCLSVHPDRQLIASCQSAPEHPVIHVWQGQQLATQAVIATRHRSIITRVCFSRQGEWIVTLGGSEGQQSIQISSWRDEEQVTFRYIEQQIILQVMFNPYVRQQVCVAGVGLIGLYSVKDSQLVIDEECRVPEQHFQALVYTSSVFGNQIESDIITGSMNGDIGLYVCGKFIVSREKAHIGGVRCLRLAELFRYKRVLISGGGEGIIKIWDVKFNEISKKNIREQLYAVRMNPINMPECQITSIDVYQCLKQQGTEHPPTLLLVSTADGSVLQAKIHNQFQGYQSYSIGTAESASIKQKINFDMTVLFTAPADLPTNFQIFNLLGQHMMVTYSSVCPFLYFWNISSGQRQKVVSVASNPTFVKFFNNNQKFIVGYADSTLGMLQLYQLNYGMKVVADVELIGDISLQKGAMVPQTAVFSQKDNRLAVGMHSQQADQILIYEQQPQADKLGYVLKIRIQQTGSDIHRLWWMDFSSSSLALLVGWKVQGGKSVQPSTIYRSYSTVTQQLVETAALDFEKLDFSSRIKASYIACNQLDESTHQDYLLKEMLLITSMAQYDRYLLLGTVNGEILVVEGDFFYKSQQEKKQVWSFIVSDTPILNLVALDDQLFISSKATSAILQLKCTVEQSWMVGTAQKDQFSELMTAQMIENRIRNVYSKRKKMEGDDQVSADSKCGVELRISAVIGRTALFCRNNLFIDLKDNIISFSGCNLLIMKYRQGQRLAQRILKPDSSPSSCHPEISCVALGECKRKLLIGTREQKAKIIIWDISTNTNLFEMRFDGFVAVSIAKLSPSNRHAALLMVTRNAQKYLVFVDLRTRRVLALHCFASPFPINDICFVYGKQLWFLVCGSNYLAEWRYQNSQLSERRYSLGGGEQLEEVRTAGIVFYSIIFVGQFAISSGSDGYLYVWREARVVKRQNAHPRQSVLSLYTSSNSKIFVSGATDGRVIIWHFGSSMIIQKIEEFSTYSGKDVHIPLKYHIQSICMTKQSLIVGNRAGEIIQFAFSSGGSQMKEEPSNNRQPMTILSSFAHEAVNSCAFNSSSRKLYVMTETEMGYGTFGVFDLATLQKIKQEKVQLKSGLVKMLVCKLSPRIFLVLKGGIMCLSYQAEVRDEKYNKLIRPKNNKDWLKCQSGIKAVALSSTEIYLAVLVAPNADQNAKIQIYRIDIPEGSFYQLYKVEENIPASIQLIDFSADHQYLVYQGPDQEQTILDLLSKQKIKPGLIQNQIEWNEDAKRTSSSMTEIAAVYSEENKMLKLVQVMNKCVLATDEMGSLRLFPYPISPNCGQVYVEHLNHVYLCVVSPDSRSLVTVGRQDRAIHLWDIVHRVQ